jgi:hypothetical protein
MNPNAIYLLEQNVDKIDDWFELSENPSAIYLLEQNLDKIDWYQLSKNPNAIHLLEQHQDKINWYNLSKNPGAIHLIKKGFEENKIPKNNIKYWWNSLLLNPSIFTCTYDYDKIRAHCLVFKEGIIKNRFHPRNIHKFTSWGYEDFSDLEE